MRPDPRLTLAFSLVVLGSLGRPLPAEGGFRKIMEVGDPAPGLPAGSVFSSTDFDGSHTIFEFYVPPMNAAGESAFGAIADPGSIGGIWLGDGSGPPTPVAVGAIPAPGLPGLDLTAGYSGIGDAGDVAFHARLQGFGVTTANDQALYGPTGAPGFGLIMREGDPAPGLGPGVIVGPAAGWWNIFLVHNPVNGAGQVAFATTLAGAGVTSGNDTALWLTDGAGGLSLVIREGDPAPGTGAGIVFGLTPSSRFAISETGRVAFGSILAGPGVTASNDRSIWTWDDSSGLALVAREGDAVPGMPGVVYASLAPLPTDGPDPNDVNGAGDVAFPAQLAGPGIGASNDHAIFVREATGSLRVAAREGDSGIPGGVELLGATLNDSGELAFVTSVTGSGAGQEVWGPDGDGGLRRIVQAGDPVPDVPDATFGAVTISPLLPFGPQPSINAHGDVAFWVGILSSEMDAEGIVFASTAGELVTVVHEGDVFELAPGELRTTDDFGLKIHPYVSLSDARQVMFVEMGTGLYLADLHTDCVDGLDNDGDGSTDRVGDPGDPGCESLADPSEHARRWVCDNGMDDDGDGLADHPADPGCNNLIAPRENPQCQDGIDNDGKPGIDFDGGASVNGGVPLDVPDPQCAGRAWWNTEGKSTFCGLGFEALLVVVPLAWWRARRRRGA
jgi:hypothetical protein